MTDTPRKKLLEVSLPLDVINVAAGNEKSSKPGHPSKLHLYWARRPLAAARAVLFAQLVDDPSSHPELFPTEEEQDAERARLHGLLEKLVVWENSNDEKLLAQAREEIRKSNGGELPAVVDPFAGGGAIPLEAQRLGLEAHASDLNPLAVLINKAMIEIPPKFAGQAPVNPDAPAPTNGWSRAEGLADDVRFYGEWMRDEAEKRIGHLYPKVKAPGGTEHTVIAWIWARTVKNPNPANPIEVPLVRSWWLSKKKGKEAWVEAKVVDGQVRYEVRHDAEGPKGDADGTVSRKGAVSIADGTPIDFKYIRSEGKAGRMGAHLIAVVGEDSRGRIYISPEPNHGDAAEVERPSTIPHAELPPAALGFRVQTYGFKLWADLFTNRQLVALTTLSDLVSEAREKVLSDALASGMERGTRLDAGGSGAEAYADAVVTYLGITLDRAAMSGNSLCRWNSTGEKIQHIFGRQAIPMVWDFGEANLFATSTGSWTACLKQTVEAIGRLVTSALGAANQCDAGSRGYGGLVISTDPPYYDNVGYSDLSDFFYVWLRHSLRNILPNVFGTILTPKSEELVANPYRHGGKGGAERFFVEGFNKVFARMREGARGDVPLTVYYAYKQQDTRDAGTSSTGWHTLLDGLMSAGWEITATWPFRTEMKTRMIASGTNALASSIVLACRPRREDAPTTTRRAFVRELKRELPESLRALMQATIAPVDLAQAAIGPGIAVYSRYSLVREPDGSNMGVRDALILINQVLDEVLGEQEADLDPDSRFALRWYRTYAWGKESSGIADQLARSSDTSLGGLVRGGILEASGGKARLIPPEELAEVWDVASDESVSIWEATVRLTGALSVDGIDRVAGMLNDIEGRVDLDAVKELGFLLYHEAEKNGDTSHGVMFNALVTSWNDLVEKARQLAAELPAGAQGHLEF
ncbi:DUF1156 domain-containing protein [Corynebacterium sanguinis]|uniref:DUF1156 domain-containing protein n=1 Tax=Corynebacterium sanguinis TaxID=2594913 RepID=UPI0011A187D8|nr:DUF1156 domain-containing protein [Corynebacterium sanguinis]MCT1696179.1 DUF1156 domain-containing protein [Corynebacterium sanguinis]MCT1715584.1 DUF1156 domain-containing protein [Corynebacterium sanguinis]TVS21314.1 DUF1156 domain-containing protein [Corynebacterium sanguinis]